MDGYRIFSQLNFLLQLTNEAAVIEVNRILFGTEARMEMLKMECKILR